MPLRKTQGNMYGWVTHTHSHLGGVCPHDCSYCYVKSFAHRSAKFQGPLRLLDDELKVKYGTGKTIFIDNCNDLFAFAVPDEWIEKILAHCCQWPENTYVFQTKNPRGLVQFQVFNHFPNKRFLGITIETNRWYSDIIHHAPPPHERLVDIGSFEGDKTFITVEPIMDFDLDTFAYWLIEMRPNFINIGADSKNHHLPEPPKDKILALIERLTKAGIEVRQKPNLKRLL